MSRRSLENRVSELEADADEKDDFEIIWRDEVIETAWSDGRDDPPERGTTRYYYDEDGEWQSEEIEDPDDPPEDVP